MGLLDTYRDDIQKLCELHKVKKLYAFGSVLTERFSADSDVSFPKVRWLKIRDNSNFN